MYCRAGPADYVVIAFSCKRRGLCPSCNARLQCDVAVHLVEHVLPRDVRYRHVVVSPPFDPRGLLSFRPDVLNAFVRLFTGAGGRVSEATDLFRCRDQESRRHRGQEEERANGRADEDARVEVTLGAVPRHFGDSKQRSIRDRGGSGRIHWGGVEGPHPRCINSAHS